MICIDKIRENDTNIDPTYNTKIKRISLKLHGDVTSLHQPTRDHGKYNMAETSTEKHLTLINSSSHKTELDKSQVDCFNQVS